MKKPNPGAAPFLWTKWGGTWASLSGRAAAARRVIGPHARRLPKGRKPTSPGEIVQLDTLTVSPYPGRPAIKQSAAHDHVARYD